MVCLLLLIPFLRTKTPLDWFIIYAYIYAVISVQAPFNRSYQTMSLLVGTESEQRLFLAILLTFVVLMKSNLSSEKIYSFLGWLGVVSITLSIIAVPFSEFLPNTFTHKAFISGLVPNKAMNGIFNCMLMPFVLNKWPKKKALTIVTVLLLTILSRSSAALLSFTAAFAVTVLPQYRLTFIPILGILFLAVGSIFTKDFLYAGGRFDAYKLFLSSMGWTEYLVGFGPSSFLTRSVYVQGRGTIEAPTQFWLYMHSDPLQFVFEFGALPVITIVAAIYYLYKNSGVYEKMSLTAMVAGSLIYYPFHQAPHLLVFFLTTKLVLNEKT